MIKWTFSTNHKYISMMYLLLGMWAGIMGVSMSMIMRIELMNMMNNFNNNEIYYMMITIHAFMMIFFMTMPIIIGSMSNWMIPLMIKSTDLIYPRMNNLSFWLLTPSMMLMMMNMMMTNNVNTGWTMYPPLSTQNNNMSMNMMIFSLHLNGLSSIFSSMNFIMTMMFMKMNFLNMKMMSLFCWSIMITSMLLIMSIPVLASAITMIIMDMNMSMMFFNPLGNGNPIIFQHLFWFFGHPEVYILILPGFGIMSQIMNQEMGKIEIFSKLNMIYAMLSIGILGFIVWVHHMFTIGVDIDTQTYFMTSTMIIAIPTGIKIFSWIMTMNSNNTFKTPTMMWSMGFILMFSMGGMTGIILANSIIDLNLHDSYYVVAHFHYVLSMGVIFTIISSMMFYMPSMMNLNMNNNWMMINFINMFMSTNLTFLPQHFMGLNGMPRRYIMYSDFNIMWNNMSSMGSMMTTMMMMILMFMIMESMISKRKIMFKLKINNKESMMNNPINNHSFNEINMKFKK